MDKVENEVEIFIDENGNILRFTKVEKNLKIEYVKNKNS